MIPSRRWDNATLSPRHRALADEWRDKGYLADVPTTLDVGTVPTVTSKPPVSLAIVLLVAWGAVAAGAVAASLWLRLAMLSWPT